MNKCPGGVAQYLVSHLPPHKRSEFESREVVRFFREDKAMLLCKIDFTFIVRCKEKNRKKLMAHCYYPSGDGFGIVQKK
jgi:hypothetical protein